MKGLDKISCEIVGWKYDILKDCTEASFRTLHRYTSALAILIIVWAFIGYNFASKYADANVFGSVVTALVFSFIIIAVERQIMLLGNTNRGVITFRIILALIMASIGALIVDQTLLAQDINRQMINRTDDEVAAALPLRLAEIDQNISLLQTEVDSLNNVNNTLSEEIAARPQITTAVVERVSIGRADSLGKPIMANEVRKSLTPNPKIKDKERNDIRIDKLQEQISLSQDKKLKEKEMLRGELNANQGFITELTAVKDIVCSSVVSLVVYVMIFGFFLLIELLIVTGMMGENSRCDYDELVEMQKSKKIGDIKRLLESK